MRHIEALVAQLTLPLYADEAHAVDDEKLLDFLQLQDTFEWNGKLCWYDEAHASVSASVDLSGSLNCEGNKRANYTVIIVDIRFDARSTVNTSS